MTVLLPVESAKFFRTTGVLDAHGWDTGARTLSGSWDVNIQDKYGAEVGTSDLAADVGGKGPYDPGNVQRNSLVFAPVTTKVKVGDIMQVRNMDWTVRHVEKTLDPTGSGELDCLVLRARATP